MGELLLIGHRGYGPTHNLGMDHTLNSVLPENSLAAFEYALEHGADGIELDVYLSKDRIPVVVHDKELEYHIKSNQKTPDIEELTVEEIQAYDIGGQQTIPTLREVLDLCSKHDKKRLIINLDVKDERCVDPILDVLSQNEQENADLIISSYKWDILRKFREKSQDIKLVPAIKTSTLFGENNIQMPGYLPMVDKYQDCAKEIVWDLYKEINFSGLDCTFVDFKSELIAWADELGVGLQISSGSDRISENDIDYKALLELDNAARNCSNVPFVLCKVDEPDLVRIRLDQLVLPTSSPPKLEYPHM